MYHNSHTLLTFVIHLTDQYDGFSASTFFTLGKPVSE